MKVFVAGATGAIGRSLVPKLVEAGREPGRAPAHASWRDGFKAVPAR